MSKYIREREKIRNLNLYSGDCLLFLKRFIGLIDIDTGI